MRGDILYSISDTLIRVTDTEDSKKTGSEVRTRSLDLLDLLDLLLTIFGMPLAAKVGGWLTAGREPSAIARQPLE